MDPCPHGTSTHINPICQRQNYISHANSYMSTRAVMCLPSGHKTPSQGSCVRRRPQASHSGCSKFRSNEGTVRGALKHFQPGSSFDVCIHLDQRQIALDLISSHGETVLPLSPGTFPHAFRKVGRAAVRIHLVFPVLMDANTIQI